MLSHWEGVQVWESFQRLRESREAQQCRGGNSSPSRLPVLLSSLMGAVTVGAATDGGLCKAGPWLPELSGKALGQFCGCRSMRHIFHGRHGLSRFYKPRCHLLLLYFAGIGPPSDPRMSPLPSHAIAGPQLALSSTAVSPFSFLRAVSSVATASQ